MAEWHILHDCIDPLATDLRSLGLRLRKPFMYWKYESLKDDLDELRESLRNVEEDKPQQRDLIQQQIVVVQSEIDSMERPPSARDFRDLIYKHNVDRAVAWFEVKRYDRLSERLHERMYGLHEQLHAIEFRAAEILCGQSGRVSVPNMPFPIQKAEDKFLEYTDWFSSEDDGEDHPLVDDWPEERRLIWLDVLMPQAQLENEILKTGRWLRDVSLFLHESPDVPSGEDKLLPESPAEPYVERVWPDPAKHTVGKVWTVKGGEIRMSTKTDCCRDGTVEFPPLEHGKHTLQMKLIRHLCFTWPKQIKIVEMMEQVYTEEFRAAGRDKKSVSKIFQKLRSLVSDIRNRKFAKAGLNPEILPSLNPETAFETGFGLRLLKLYRFDDKELDEADLPPDCDDLRRCN